MKPIDRRGFVAVSATGVSGLCTGPLALSAAQTRRVAGANERVILALIGAGGRGTALAEAFAGRKDAEIGYVCDLHEDRLAAACKTIGARQNRAPRPVKVMQQVLASKDVNAVIMATPDHWHALGTILACQAGKDVYVEKPPSHNIWEGRKMVEAARRYKCLVQVGTQNRSAPYLLAARDYIRKGRLGSIHLCKVFNLKSGGAFQLPAKAIEPPRGFNWDAWLGPASDRPYNARLFQGGWHYYWDYSGGDLADDGIHQLDLAMMLLGDPSLPTSIHASGGRFAFRDDREVPDTQEVTFELPNMLMTLELSQWAPYMDKIAMDIRNGDLFPFWPQCATRVEIYGTRGLMYVGRHGGGWQVFGRPKRQSRPGQLIAQEFGRPGDQPHQDNFIECIKNRRRPTADIEIGHKSAVMIHLGNIAHRLGNHKLIFDAKSERFIGNDAANQHVRRHYRKGYQVPDKV